MLPWNFFPFTKDMQSQLQKMNPDEINQYVQNIMNNMFSSSFPNNMKPEDFMKGFQPYTQMNNQEPSPSSKDTLNYSVYETHEYIFVRVQVKKEEWLQQLRLYHTSNLLILEHIPDHSDKHSITLPSLVKKRGTTAHLKEDMLEIKLPKDIDLQFSEVDVSEI